MCAIADQSDAIIAKCVVTVSNIRYLVKLCLLLVWIDLNLASCLLHDFYLSMDSHVCVSYWAIKMCAFKWTINVSATIMDSQDLCLALNRQSGLCLLLDSSD